MRKFLLSIAFLVAAITGASAQACNPNSGWLEQVGTITVGHILAYGPDCSQVMDGGPGTTQAGFGINVQNFGAQCSGGLGLDNTSAFQIAMNSVPSGGRLYIPACSVSGQAYRFIGAGVTILNRSTPITITGDGGGSILFIDATVPNTRDFLLMSPISHASVYTFENFTIIPSNSARHAINWQLANGTSAFNVNFNKLLIFETAGGHSINVDNLDPSGGIAYSQITNSNLASVRLGNVGDGIVLENNVIGPSLNTTIAVYSSQVVGAAGLVLRDNVITSRNCFICIDSGAVPTIANNELETPTGIANVYGFMIDIRGTVANIFSPQILNNSLSVLAGTGNPVPLRIQAATNALISGGRISVQSGSHIAITAAATDTSIDRNTQFVTVPTVGVPPVITDAGARTGNRSYIMTGTLAAPSVASIANFATGMYFPTSAPTPNSAIGFGINGSQMLLLDINSGVTVANGFGLTAGGSVNNAGTVTGGTGVASNLILKATSGAGAGAEFIDFLAGNNGALRLARLCDNAGIGGLSIGTTNCAANGITMNGNTGGGGFSVERATTVLPGASFTFQAGGAQLLANNANGGDFFFITGTSTGAGTSKIWCFVSPGNAAPTADNAIYNSCKFWGDGAVSLGNGVTDLGCRVVAPPSECHVDVAGFIRIGQVTIANLPACNAGRIGARYTVNNQNGAPVYNAAPVAGGAIVAGVICNGAAWLFGDNDNHSPVIVRYG